METMDICGTAFLFRQVFCVPDPDDGGHGSDKSLLLVDGELVEHPAAEHQRHGVSAVQVQRLLHAAVGFFAVRSRNRRLPRYRMISSTEHRIQPMGYASATETKPMFRLFVMNR